MCFFKKTIKSALPAFLFFVLTFTGCSYLEQESTSSITFTINASRLVSSNSRRSEPDSSKVFMDIELGGSFSAKQTVTLEQEKEITVTFAEVPVGANVYVLTRIYTLFDNQKVVLYQGKTETKTIQKEDNEFKATLEKAYNYITETESACIVSWPLFTNYTNGEKLPTNKLSFNKVANTEEFSWGLENLYEYQKARITIKADTQKTDENYINFYFLKGNSQSGFFQQEIPVSSERTSWEFEIPQGIKLDNIYLTNKWILQDTPEESHWADDFSCTIEKIEFLKDASLIDPEFNQVYKTDKAYIVRNPALQISAFADVYKNSVTFDSISGIKKENNPFSAAYWEFDDLASYDKVTISYKCENANETGMKFSIKGYVPRNLPSIPDCKHGTDLSENATTLQQAGQTETYTYMVSNLLQGLDGYKVTAIEFQNQSYLGLWEELNFGGPWTLRIEEIMLQKFPSVQIGLGLDTPDDSNITVTQDTSSIPGAIIFTAPDTYSNYTWKVNNIVQDDAVENIFVFDTTSYQSGIYDVSLLADSDSWHTQITLN